jgi:hypothetical protein
MQAVLQALLDVDGFEHCLVDVVNRGGDADTTGAIAGMLAGALYGASALPARWLQALDPEIAKRCRAQARALIAEAPFLVVGVGDQRPAGGLRWRRRGSGRREPCARNRD